MLSFKDTKTGLAVYLDGKKIGTIMAWFTRFRYVPNAGTRYAGDPYDTVAEVKRTL